MSPSSKKPFLALALVALSACSGPEEPSEVLTRIDDMEGDGSQILWRAPGRSDAVVPGRWQSFADVSCTALSPPPSSLDADRWAFVDLAEPHTTFAGRRSTRAARLTTTAPFINTWGAGMRFDLTSLVPDVARTSDVPDDLPCPTASRDLAEWEAESVDLRGFRAVTFFAMADPNAGSTTLSVMLLDRNSDPRGGVCDPVQASPKECFNSFSASVELDGNFRRFTVNFAELVQDPHWGYRPSPNEPDLEHVYGIAFQVFTPGGVCPKGAVCPGGPPRLTFDVTVDDVHFVNR
jgi:hypothetical protein